MLEIINDILDFSKIEAGKLTLESADFNLEEVFKHIHVLTSNKAELKGLKMISRIDSSLPRFLYGDRTRLGQVLLNLVNNAVKFTESGTVTMQARFVNQNSQDGWIRFEVSDTGIGLSEAQCQALFQPFTQADASISRKFGGTGLGLAICKQLVELMEGKIGVESVESHGSTFWFEARFCLTERKMEMSVGNDFETTRETMADSGKIVEILTRPASASLNKVVNNEPDLDKIDYSKPVRFYSQTTQPIVGFTEMINGIRKRYELAKNPEPDFIPHNTICSQVSHKEPRLKKFAAEHDLILFVSGKKSSNGLFLYEVCRSINPQTYFISVKNDINKEWFNKVNKVGVCGATSTPMWLMEEIAEIVRAF